MSSERDELANRVDLHAVEVPCGDVADALNKAFNRAIHDAWQQGYEQAVRDRRPRQVTTVEELNALPVGSVVLSDAYRHSIEDWPVSFQRWGDGDWHRGARSGDTHPDNFLPATVLHVGGAE